MGSFNIGQSVVLIRDTEVKTRGGNMAESKRPKLVLKTGTKMRINRFSGNGNMHVSVAIDNRMRKVAVPQRDVISLDEWARTKVHNEQAVIHDHKKDRHLEAPIAESVDEEVKTLLEEVVKEEPVKKPEPPKPTPNPTPFVDVKRHIDIKDPGVQWMWERLRDQLTPETYDTVALVLGLEQRQSYNVAVEFGGLKFTTEVLGFSYEDAEETALKALIEGVK